MLGLPGETQQTLESTQRFLDTAPLDFVQISPYWPVPMTPIYDTIVQETGIDTWRSIIVSGPREDLPLLDSEFTMLELHAVASSMYSGFYFEPRRMLKLVGNIRSFPQFRRYASAGLDVMRGALPTVFGRHS